ncbi:MAG: hypothetical protein GX879_10610 [Bacteroidales bacterium]|nr:hypothetical protein [Bacteroidales bacterium]
MRFLFAFVFTFMLSFSAFTQSAGSFEYQTLDTTIIKNGIEKLNIYYRESCGRCTNMMDAFDNAGIEYEKLDYDIEENKRTAEKLIYNTLPNKAMGYSTRFPLVEINETFYFCIANHHEFTLQLLEFYSFE